MTAKKRIIVSVSNDLVTDQRVKKVCDFLYRNGFEVILLGRRFKHSLDITDRPYTVKRFKLWFNKGALFYANLNLRLFFYLLGKRTHWLLSNDLDTLPANYYAKKFKRNCRLVYDTHELFCEVPELQHSRLKKKIWLFFEKRIFPKLTRVYTVNQSIAGYYEERYKVKPAVVRNISSLPDLLPAKTRQELGLPGHKFIAIIQGSGINAQRGNEEVVEAFKLLPDNFLLLVIGSGDVIAQLTQYVNDHNLQDKVWFKPRQKYADLMQYTVNSNVGISMDKDTNLNYRFSLPNKLFDFMHAGIPVLASNLPEIAAIVTQYQTGIICSSHSPTEIAKALQNLQSDISLMHRLHENCLEARKILRWENEEKELEKIYEINKPA